MVWFDQAASEVHLQQVCARCTFLLKGHVAALWAPLDQAPPLEVIVHHLRQELARRQPRVHYGYGNVAWTFTGNMNTGTGTGGYFTW